MEAEPVLEPEAEAYLDAFFTLSPSRTMTVLPMGGALPNGLLLSEIESFCRLYGVRNVARFVEFMRALDGEFLRYQAEKR